MTGLPSSSEPPTEHTYRMRRGVVLVALVLVVVLVGWVLKMLFGSNNTQTAVPPPSNVASAPVTSESATSESSASSPAASASSASSSAASPTSASSPASSASSQASKAASSVSSAPVATCAADDLVVRPHGKTTLKSGSPTTIQISFTNGKTPCVLDFASTPLTMAITSGTDNIWTTEHCSTWQPKGRHLLKAGQSWTFKVAWPTLRSRAGCKILSSHLAPGWYVATTQLGSDGERAQLVMRLHD